MTEKLSRSAWRKTPYAASSAQNPDAAIHALLGKYGVTEVQWTVGTGEHGRPACMLRFILGGKGYRIMLEALDADAGADERLKQIKRAIFHYLKSTLEISQVFFTPEEALFAFLELPHGQTMIDAARPHMARLTGPDFGRLVRGENLLPAPDEGRQ